MRLAVLMTNTDESAFAQVHPKDGEKFTALVQFARPDWETRVFAVKDGVFPASLGGFDGAIVTGSPASVNSGAEWVGRLLVLLREAVAARLPVFGACFGHQALALALGGAVGDNPGGFVHGLVPMQLGDVPDWARALPDPLHLYASHGEQVTQLPDGARVWASSEGCPAAGFSIGRHVFTTQHHPEMSADFFAALTDAFANDLGAETVARARGSMTRPADRGAFAETVARFFEQGQASAASRSITVA
ncbi:MAG: type 1 glutamine amidotransferase [Pseudooceanicola sp.]|nr:type 1 glutamine amidotransferase [Pseudooceanicola sp.]